ncbi:MAG: hypothetical protein VYE31_01015 [Pseudomonadota bacterium]|nr:hypothetical protein [Pseudomonadota bacterium]
MKKQNNLIIILIIFTLPFIFSYYFLKIQDSNERWETTNYGKFIEPLVPLTEFEIKLFNNALLNNKDLINKWTLIYITKNQCLKECSKDIHLLRQVHIALGKDINRVQRVFLSNYDEKISFLKNLEAEYPNLLFSNIRPNQLYKIIHKISKKDKQIYLVNPAGNVILTYKSNFNGQKLLKDLKKLLKFSKKE